jgi:hypothetical protein
MSDFDLDSEIEALGRAIANHPNEAEHTFSDFVVACLATDVCDAAQACRHLAATRFGHTSYPLARRAYESAIEISILVADESRYDERCACLVVFERFEAEYLSRRGSGIDGVQTAAEVRRMVEDLVRADADTWDSLAPGQGMHVRRAWETFTKVPGLSLHWSGKAQVQFLGEVTGTDSTTDSFLWGALSMETHARARVGGLVIRREQDRIVLDPAADDKLGPLRVCDLACHMASAALDVRRSWVRSGA